MARPTAGSLIPSLVVPTLLLVAGSGLVMAADITKPEARLGVVIAPHIETINEVDVTDDHAIAIVPGVFIDLPLSRRLGVVLGAGIPYRFGTSSFDDRDRTKIHSDLLGGQVEVGLSIRPTTWLIMETLGVFGVGHAHVWYTREGFNNNDYGSYTDAGLKLNLLFTENAGAKIGLSLAYDELHMRLRDEDDNRYGTKATGLAYGLVGSLSF